MNNNPAGRLLNILNKGKTANGASLTRNVWADILNVHKTDDSILIGSIGKVFSLVNDISTELSLIDNVKVSQYMRWTKQLETAFSNSHLDAPWSTFIKHIDDPVFDYLHMTAGMLSSNRPQPSLSKSQLDEIYENAKELVNDILESDLPVKLKKYFLEQLRKICRAIEEYSITGSTEIVDIIESTFGRGILSKEFIEGRETHQPIKKFWGFMASTALIISSLSGTLQIADFTQKIFPELTYEKALTVEHHMLEPVTDIRLQTADDKKG